jgi:hypothetical protein
MSDVSPARIGVLIDYLDAKGGYDENIMRSLELVADEFNRRASQPALHLERRFDAAQDHRHRVAAVAAQA